jgi:hypothetical protein
MFENLVRQIVGSPLWLPMPFFNETTINGVRVSAMPYVGLVAYWWSDRLCQWVTMRSGTLFASGRALTAKEAEAELAFATERVAVN